MDAVSVPPVTTARWRIHNLLNAFRANSCDVWQTDSDGRFLLAWGDNEVGPGHFGGYKSMPGPLAIAVDDKDQIWVSSTNNHLQLFTADGRFLRRLSGEEKEPGQFRLPHGLAFDSQQFLYVADARNSRIQKLSV